MTFWKYSKAKLSDASLGLALLNWFSACSYNRKTVGCSLLDWAYTSSLLQQYTTTIKVNNCLFISLCCTQRYKKTIVKPYSTNSIQLLLACESVAYDDNIGWAWSTACARSSVGDAHSGTHSWCCSCLAESG